MVCIIRYTCYVYTYIRRGLRVACSDAKAIPEPLFAEQQYCSPAFCMYVLNTSYLKTDVAMEYNRQQTTMKKLFLCLVTVLLIAMSAFAQVRFRANQNLCRRTEQIILYSSGRYVLYDDGIEAYSGSYTVDATYNAIILDVEGRGVRCNYTLKKDGQNIASLSFRGNLYYPCSR